MNAFPCVSPHLNLKEWQSGFNDEKRRVWTDDWTQSQSLPCLLLEEIGLNVACESWLPLWPCEAGIVGVFGNSGLAPGTMGL